MSHNYAVAFDFERPAWVWENPRFNTYATKAVSTGHSTISPASVLPFDGSPDMYPVLRVESEIAVPKKPSFDGSTYTLSPFAGLVMFLNDFKLSLPFEYTALMNLPGSTYVVFTFRVANELAKDYPQLWFDVSSWLRDPLIRYGKWFQKGGSWQAQVAFWGINKLATALPEYKVTIQAGLAASSFVQKGWSLQVDFFFSVSEAKISAASQ